MNGSRGTRLGRGVAAVAGMALLPLVLAASPPGEVRWPSHVGEVVFPHRAHVEELGLECTECHHPTRAPRLVTPHPEVFSGELRRCALCHREPVTAGGSPAPAGRQVGRCDSCHGPRTTRAGDFPGLRVALHATCGKCHEIGTGAAASASCATCHAGPATPWRMPAGAPEGRD